MDDEEARFAAQLARQQGRDNEWMNIKAEHTPYEWAFLLALRCVEPWGEDRADMRAARNTAVLAHALSWSPLNEEQLQSIINDAQFYLDVNQPPEIEMSPEQIAAASGL